MKIIAAAVRYQVPRLDPLCPEYGPIIFSAPQPARHSDILIPLSQLNSGAALEAEQGFLTNTGLFLSRSEGLTLAKENGQLIRQHHPHQLFSEDLW